MKKFSLLTLLIVFFTMSLAAHDFSVMNSDGKVIFYSKTSSTKVAVTTETASSGSSTTSKYNGVINIPSSVTYEGVTYRVTSIKGAFKYCTGLTGVSIPNSVDSIYSGCFYGCTALQSITIPESVKYIGLNAFEGCTTLGEICISNLNNWAQNDFGTTNCPLDNGATLKCNGVPVTSLDELDENCKKIGSGAFSNCLTLTSANFPSTIESIGDNAFIRCKGIKEFSIPGSVTTIGNNAFYDCTNLKKVVFEDSDTKLSIGYNNIRGRSMLINCKLEKIYIGRPYSCTGSSTSYTPFYDQSVVEAVVNHPQGGGSPCYAENTYIGPRCADPSKSFTINNTKNLFIFTSELKSITVDWQRPIYFPNKDAVPTIIVRQGELTYDYSGPLYNLVDFEDFVAGSTYEYGNLSQSDIKIVNNVTEMNATVEASANPFSAGIYTGIPVNFKSELWNTTIDIPCTYTITPAPLLVLANDARKKYGEENPDFSCIYAGFKNDETEAVLTKKPTITTTATVNSLPGTYPIIPSSAESRNYSFTYERGVLTVTKAENKLTWDQTIPEIDINKTIIIDYQIEHNISEPLFSGYDTDIISLFKDGENWVIKGKNPGKTSISLSFTGNDIYDNSNTITKTITVKDLPVVPAESVSLSKTSISLEVGTFEVLSAVVYPENTTDKTIKWTSNDESIAKVSSDGSVMALGVGSTYITATCGTVSATCAVTVLPVPVSGIYLNKSSLNLTVGDSEKLVATVVPEAATEKTVVWTSSDSNVASVDNDGLVAAKNAGSAIITATCGNVSAACIVTVKSPEVSEIHLNKSQATLKVTETDQLVATVLPESASGYNVVWSSSDNTIATVDNGLVTAKQEGSVKITASVGELSATCTVYVIRNNQTIVWDQEIGSIKAGDEVVLTAYSTSSLPIEYEIAIGSDIGAIVGSTLKTSSNGVIKVNALQLGDDIYYPADPVSKTINVEKVDGISFITADNIKIRIEGSELCIEGNSEYDVYTITGLLVYRGSENRIYLTPNTPYILRINGTSFKFVTE